MPWREDEKTRRRALSLRQFALVLGLLVVVGAVLGLLGTRIARELEALTAAPSDNQQWEMAQVEVEALVLLDAIKSVELGLATGLDEVRKRFDIFYSRISATQTRRGRAADASVDEATAALGRIRTGLDRLAPLIDGADTDLRAHLGDLREEVARLRVQARSIALAYVRFFAQKSDAERKSLADLIEQTSIVGAVFFVFLSLSLIVLVRLFQLSDDRARALTESRDRFEKTISASLDAIVVVDDAGLVLDVNPAAEQMFGYSRNAFVGSSLVSMVIPERLRESHAAGFARYVATGRRRTGETGRLISTARRADGTEFPVELSLGASVRGDQRIVIGFVRDISERVRIEQELIGARDDALAAARARSDLLAFMSHEMRTPLNGVLAILDLLRETPLDERQTGYIDTAMRSGEILLHLIADALDVTRLQSGVPMLREEVFDLAELIEEVAAINRPAAAAKGDGIVVDSDLPPGGTLGDRNRLRQILMNLVGNAIKFTRDGTIRLEVRIERALPESPTVEIAVVDTGIGIAQEEIDHVFEEFVALEPTDARIPRGSGLGLAIARRLVELMGGTLTATSRVGAGSRFVLTLPYTTAAVETSAASPDDVEDVARPRSGLRVLLVEDNPTNRLVTHEMLTMLGASVEEAEDGEVGVAEATVGRYDLVLMDLGLPKLDGRAATRAIRADPRAASRDAPIVGLTAHALPGVEADLVAAGMNRCLYKPLRLADLRALLVDLFGTDPQAGAEAPSDGDEGAEATILDVSELAELAEVLGQDRLVARLEAFRGEIDAAVSSLSALPLAERGAAAHRLAGSAAVFGAVGLRAASTALETACAGGDAAEADRCSAALEKDAKATIVALADLVADLRA
ncbi:hybrid sensor histidine kinase/response regulator [Pinisolibacter aquiterrae]|uniref:hybrid sensor histidine kinase/response regulator n=1 Tax=Pinisolibacter aquiterrae TaxID=2815579 RepID=UPI001C3DA683|nr:PAS domain-containing hybrid sensor histidine kinase/response regulator [Pinisolibacter aquiterrae]MBV5264745.1 PAS domain S-box protein [Pinisolibacter aquiterrae]MCC8237084.1 PAS domain S-box protein [Pinisolibacter aquiterrae]